MEKNLKQKTTTEAKTADCKIARLHSLLVYPMVSSYPPTFLQDTSAIWNFRNLHWSYSKE